MKTNYVLIDYENVQPQAIAALDKEHFKVIVFFGANQAKVTYEVASVLHRMGPRAEYIKIAGNGPNALDFHIAFYIGQFACQEPDAYFHIVSKDAGFDPLIQHLKEKRILVDRCKDVRDIPTVKAENLEAQSEKLAVIINDLQRRGASKPRTAKTLASTINALFQKQLPDPDITSLLNELQRQGVVTVSGNKVTYALP